MKQLLKKESGAVTIIEAAFVFPITFFVVFFMIMAGEAYYQYTRVAEAVTVAALDGAARCENPMLGDVIKKKTVGTDPTATDVMPYRYIFTGEAKRIADGVTRELNSQVNGYQPLLFRSMSPQNVSVKVDLHMNPLVSSFPITCSFDVPFPIRMIFSNQTMKFQYSMQTTAPISDPAEFVRNVAMIGDVLERNKQIREFGGKVRGCMDQIGSYTN